jgi:hypothetical protein
LLNARLVRRFPVRQLLLIGLVASTMAAVILVVLVRRRVRCAGRPATLVFGGGQPWPGLSQRHRARSQTCPGSWRCVCGARGLHVRRWHPGVPADRTGRGGNRDSDAAVVAGGAVAALLATVLLTRGDHPEPSVDANACVSAQPIEE